MIVIFTGLPGSGKSYKLGQTAIDLLYRNRGYYEKQMKAYTKDPSRFNAIPERRILWTNLKLAQSVLDEFNGYIKEWTELRQLVPIRDADVLIDEVATYFDARLWENLGIEIRRWLHQHRKFGIEIYGTAQDFAQVDKSFRRLTSNLLYINKLIGSRDVSPTRPNPRIIWGISFVREMDPVTYDELKSKFKARGMIPTPMLITRAGTEVFDTRAEVKLSGALPMKHILKTCELPGCNFHKVVHA